MITKYLELMNFKKLLIFLWVVLGAIYVNIDHLFVINIPKLFLVFVIFQLFYAGIYIINDLIDYKFDIKNPVKRTRPIASGRISRNQAFVFMLLLMGISFILCFLLIKELLIFLIFFLVYNLIYSFVLKKIILIDTLVSGLTHAARFFMGGFLFGKFNAYFIVFALFLFVSTLSIAKRLREVRENQTTARKSNFYTLRLAKLIWVLSAFILFIFFLLTSGLEHILILIILIIYLFFIIFYRIPRIRELLETLLY